MKAIKSLKMNYSVTALICALLGLILLIWPGQTTQIACITVGAVLGIYGVLQIIFYLATKEKTMMSHSMMVFGIVLAVIGGFIVWKPETIMKAIPMIVGILIIIHGLHNGVQAIDLKKMGYSNWWIALLLAVLTVALGIILVCNPFDALDAVVRLIGIFLLYDGLSDMWILSRVFKTRRKNAKIIDTDAVIVDEESTTNE